MTFEEIYKQLKKKEYAPVYFLMGEESFFYRSNYGLYY
jgi:DNA polymerase-3 subunit delta